jgi:hypothetical protein
MIRIRGGANEQYPGCDRTIFIRGQGADPQNLDGRGDTVWEVRQSLHTLIESRLQEG